MFSGMRRESRDGGAAVQAIGSATGHFTPGNHICPELVSRRTSASTRKAAWSRSRSWTNPGQAFQAGRQRRRDTLAIDQIGMAAEVHRPCLAATTLPDITVRNYFEHRPTILGRFARALK